MLKFTKMHGLGNDFVVVNTADSRPRFNPDIIQTLADRRTGIGFDQLLLLGPPEDDESDFTYRIFNADGQEVEQCGNGARCIAHYIFVHQLTPKKLVRLATLSGSIDLEQEEDGQIKVNMGPPKFDPAKIPFIVDQQAKQYQLNVAGHDLNIGAVSMGNPHVVVKVKDVFQAPVQQIGQALQHHPAFPQQANVGFMEVVNEEFVRLRVFERGVGETRSCGSGACAAVAVGRLWDDLAERVTVQLPGGKLIVSCESPAAPVYLTGPAVVVYTGETDLL